MLFANQLAWLGCDFEAMRLGGGERSGKVNAESFSRLRPAQLVRGAEQLDPGLLGRCDIRKVHSPAFVNQAVGLAPRPRY